MTLAGWIMMITVVSSITLLLVWCAWKVARLPNPSEHVHPIVEIDTPDRHEPK